MALHIGIVACSAEGAALCYRTICAEGAALLGPHAHPEVSLHSHCLAEYVTCLERGDVQGVGALMLSSAEKLARAGADFLVCPDNTIHQAFAHVAPRSPLPWLHIAEVVADEAVRRGFRRAGLTGTRWLVDSDVYPEALAKRGLEWMRPSAQERDEISRIIMDELVCGVFEPESVDRCRQVIERMKSGGCDAVILGCTELPLILDDANSPLPTLDSTRLLARAALRRATGDAAAVQALPEPATRTTSSSPEVTLEVATPADADLLTNLLELYVHDMSEIFPLRIGADGHFGYDRLPLYWSQPATHFAYLIRAAGEIAGFALVTLGSPASDDPDDLDLTEFFVLRSYRRSGVGRRAALLLWDRLPGQWVVRVSERNRPALPFWRGVVEEYTRGAYGEREFPGKTHMFRVFSFANAAPAPRR